MNSTAIETGTAPLFVDAGGRRLGVTARGRGEPLVLLEVGFGAESCSWAAVADGVADLTRVCSYDRAGRGASDPAPQPRQPDDLVQDARRVVQALAASEPVVLAGQSFGGLIARLYAAQHPAEVAGVVLVDSMHEDQFEAIAPHFPAPAAGEAPALTSMRAFWRGGWRDPSRNVEHIDMLSCRAAAHRIHTLGKMPLRVLEAHSFMQAPFGEERGRKLQTIWHELQGRLARLSKDSSLRVVEQSGHFIQTEHPQAVVEAIAELVAAIRAARSRRRHTPA